MTIEPTIAEKIEAVKAWESMKDRRIGYTIPIRRLRPFDPDAPLVFDPYDGLPRMIVKDLIAVTITPKLLAEVHATKKYAREKNPYEQVASD